MTVRTAAAARIYRTIFISRLSSWLHGKAQCMQMRRLPIGAVWRASFEAVQISRDMPSLLFAGAGAGHSGARAGGLGIDDPLHQVVQRIGHNTGDVDLARNV